MPVAVVGAAWLPEPLEMAVRAVAAMEATALLVLLAQSILAAVEAAVALKQVELVTAAQAAPESLFSR